MSTLTIAAPSASIAPFAALISAIKTAKGSRFESANKIADCVAQIHVGKLSKDDKDALSDAAEGCGFSKGTIVTLLKMCAALRGMDTEARAMVLKNATCALLISRPYTGT